MQPSQPGTFWHLIILCKWCMLLLVIKLINLLHTCVLLPMHRQAKFQTQHVQMKSRRRHVKWNEKLHVRVGSTMCVEFLEPFYLKQSASRPSVWILRPSTRHNLIWVEMGQIHKMGFIFRLNIYIIK